MAQIGSAQPSPKNDDLGATRELAMAIFHPQMKTSWEILWGLWVFKWAIYIYIWLYHMMGFVSNMIYLGFAHKAGDSPLISGTFDQGKL